MISLFLDTCSAKLIVGLYKDFEELYLSVDDNDNDLSKKVLVKIDEAFENTNLNIQDIDNIFVVNGPGSFTGVRIGVTVAKTIAWGLNKKIYTVSELEVLASNSSKNYIVPMIDARRECVYAGLYDSSIKNLIDDSYINLKDLYNKIKRHVKIDDVEFVSYNSIKCDKIASIEIPKLNIGKLISKHIDDNTVNPHTINPVYLKNTEAEEKLGVNV